MAAVYDHFPWILWPPAVSQALCGIPALQQAGTLWYTDTGKQLNEQTHTRTHPHKQFLLKCGLTVKRVQQQTHNSTKMKMKRIARHFTGSGFIYFLAEG